MPPLLSLKQDRDRKAKAVLNFAASIAERIADNPTDSSLASDLQDNILILPINISKERQAEFDSKGTEVWNLSTRLSRSSGDIDRRSLCLLRVFAFNLLDSAHWGQTRTSANCVRLLKVAFKAAKFCLDTTLLEQGVKVLERAAAYIDELSSEINQLTPEDAHVLDRLKAEYFVLRTTLAWKQSKLDVAEHMYQKVAPSLLVSNPTSAEALADALYEIGKDLFAQKQFELATRWLERAYNTLSEQEPELLSDNAGELRLSVMQLLVKSLIRIRNSDTLDEARRMVGLMDMDFADKMVVSLLKLELLSSEAVPNPDEYYSVMQRMLRTIPFTRSNFKTVMHHLHKLRKQSTTLTCNLLDDLLSLRLFAEEKEEWIERASIMRIWITTSGTEAQDQTQSLVQVLDNISANSKAPFSAAATHAAQTLLWKQVESAYTQGQYDLAESWCRLSDHELFQKCGDINRAKIMRKTILCSIARLDLSSAREAFFRMSEAQQNSSQTRYLMYKVALRCDDTDLAAESLDIVCKQSSKDATLLYACVLEAQNRGDKKQAVTALQKVLQRYDYRTPKGVSLPALLRCTVKLMKSAIGKNETPSNETIEDLCKLFEGAAEKAKKSRRQPTAERNHDFNSIEIGWFSRNSYNMAIELCAVIHPSHLVRLCSSCIQFINLLQVDAVDDEVDSLRLRYILCEFLAVCAGVVLARAEDNVDDQLQHYLSTRHHATSLRALIEEHLKSEFLEEATRKDLIEKHFEVVKYELEAVLRLGKWDDIDSLFHECWRYGDTTRWQTMADLAFLINQKIVTAGMAMPYQAKVLAFIQRIINRSWKATNDISSLARWIRCLFQIALSSDEKISLYCIDQAVEIAQKQHNTSTPFPTTEIEWLSTTAFNRAVDFYCAQDDANCKLWAETALTLAASAEDGGSLRKLLQEKYSGLSWDNA